MSNTISWTNSNENELGKKIPKDRRIVEKLFELYPIPAGAENVDVSGMKKDDVRKLFQIIKTGVTFHEGGKIAGEYSLDGSSTSCEFCAKMRELAAKYPDLGIVCGKCYDYEQENGYRTYVQPRHEITQFVLSHFLLSVDDWKILLFDVPENAYFRFNSSGDLRNVTEGKNHIRVCKARTDLQAAQWTKNSIVWRKAVDSENGRPSNMRGVLSTCRINATPRNIENLAEYYDTTFTVYNDARAVNTGNKCACVGDKNHKCRECGYKCYKPENSGGWKYGTNTVEQLRD